MMPHATPDLKRAYAVARARGKLTYIQSTFETYASYEPEYYTISANGKKLTERAFLVAVCNASQYGNNAYIAPSASINDGLLDVTIIHAGNTLSTALVGVDMMTGMIERNMLIHTFRTDNIVIERERRGRRISTVNRWRWPTVSTSAATTAV